MNKTKVLFVCLGNICRSPLGEGIFKHKVKALGKADSFQVDSCGTGSYHVGGLPDPGSIKVAEENELDITDQRARQLNVKDLQDYDYILAMDRSNLSNIKRLGSTKAKLKLLRDYDPVKNRSPDVPDPYGMGYNGFQDVYQIIDECLEVFIDEELQLTHP